MGHRQMIDRFGEAEPVLPLVDLHSIQVADALRVDWPETDAIIGNPPFLGSQWLRGAFGDDYVDWLKREFGVGVKDFCTYWLGCGSAGGSGDCVEDGLPGPIGRCGGEIGAGERALMRRS